MPEHTIVVVDDEPIIREGLTSSFRWLDHGFRLVGSAANGREAMDVIARERPDAVITDIKMPIVAGLELVSWIRRNAPGTQVVLLSGYDDFEYARAGLRLGAFAYVLKLEIKRELPRVLSELGVRLDQRETHRAAQTLSDLALIDRELRRLEDGQTAAVALAGSLSAFVVFVASPTVEPGEVARQVSTAGFLGHHRSNRLMAALVQASDLEGLAARAGALSAECQMVADGQRFAMGLPFQNETDSASSFRSATKALDVAILEGSMGLSEYLLVERRLRRSRPRRDWRKIALAVLVGRAETVRRELAAETEATILARDAAVADVRLGIETSLALIIDSLPPEAGDLRSRLNKVVAETGSHDLITSLCSWCEDELVAIGESIAAFRAEPQGDRIGRALSLIRRNYMTNLMLEDAAEYACMSPSYFAATFRKATGRNFTTYLRELRMEEASQLLSGSSVPLGEVAAAVGYTDVKYFMRVFRRHFGTTPNEYRRASGSADA